MSDKDIATFYNNIEAISSEPDNALVLNNQRVLLSFFLEPKNNYSGILADPDGILFKQLANAAMGLFRHSPEYKTMIRYLTDKYPKLKQCVVYENFKDIELHHYPLTLYDITLLIMKRRVEKRLPFNTFIIAKELMNYHEKEMVGFIPVCKSVHKRIHAGYFKPYIDHVHGDWLGFLKEFRNHYTRETLFVFINKLERNKMRYEYSVELLKKNADNLKVSYAVDTLTDEKLRNIRKIHKINTVILDKIKEVKKDEK